MGDRNTHSPTHCGRHQHLLVLSCMDLCQFRLRPWWWCKTQIDQTLFLPLYRSAFMMFPSYYEPGRTYVPSSRPAASEVQSLGTGPPCRSRCYRPWKLRKLCHVRRSTWEANDTQGHTPEEQLKLWEARKHDSVLIIAHLTDSVVKTFEPACVRRLTGGNVALNFLPHGSASAPATTVLVLQTYVR